MIKINDNILNIEEEDCILMSLYHYQLIWLNNDFKNKYNKNKIKKITKIIQNLINEITKDYEN